MIPRKRRSTLRGTGLYIDPRTGNYIWRRVHEVSGKRLLRSTRTTNLTVAISRAAKFEDDYQAEVAGLRRYEGWKLELLPLVAKWLEDVRASEDTREKYRRQVTSAATRLRLTRLADLDDIPRLDRAVSDLERAGAKRKTIVRTIQKPLKQFSKWAASKRHIDKDPLAGWRTLDLEGVEKRPRRALHPEEVARALLAASYLDGLYERAHAQRPLYLALLISAARVGSVLALDLGELDQEKQRLTLGAHVRNKHRGEAALDDATLAEIVASLGTREEGPLFPSPRGGRGRVENVLDDWREAFGLGLVLELRPATPVELAARVTYFLAHGNAGAVESGNPNIPSERREARSAEVRAVAAEIGDEWRARMVGVDVHALKVSHRTWGEIAGVHPLVLDKQCGHATPAGASALEAARAILANPIGRKHYVDMGLELIDARRAAEAVRKLLDDALALVRQAASWHTEWHTGVKEAKRPRA